MKKIVLLTLFWSVVLFSMQIERIDMAKEAVSVGDTYNVEGITENFPIHQKAIYGIIKYSQASLKDKVLIKWIAEDAINIPNYEIAKSLYPVDRISGVMRARLTLSAKVWPKGHYRMEVYHNGQKIIEKKFSIGLPRQSSSTNTALQSDKIKQLFFSTYAGIDNEGYVETKGVTDTFEATQHKIFAVVSYQNLAVPGKFEFRWYVEKAGDVENQMLINTPIKNNLAAGAVYSQIEMDEDWPMGDFRIDIYYNGKKLATKGFKIRGLSPHLDIDNTAHPSIIQDLIGSKWVDKSAAKPLILSFPSPTQFNYGDNIFTCTINDKVIKVNGNKGVIVFPYTIKNDKLYLELNGNTGVFERMKPSAKPAVTPLGRLQGKYCSKKDESNEWITFDGAGHFSFGSLANSIVAAEGTYTIKGEWISVYVKGENLGKILITKQNDTHIAAFEFDKITYTQALCPR